MRDCLTLLKLFDIETRENRNKCADISLEISAIRCERSEINADISLEISAIRCEISADISLEISAIRCEISEMWDTGLVKKLCLFPVVFGILIGKCCPGPCSCARALIKYVRACV